MYDDKKVLKSKLRFSGASETILRNRLMPVMSEISLRRLTMVVAGAGYGKTTLVKQVISHFNLTAVWYRLDRYDSDFETFFCYLKAGIEEHLGKIDMPNVKAGVSAEKTEQVLHDFLKEVENRIQNNLVIVLDDYYLVHDSEEINRAVEFLTENIHHQVNLVLISRSEPPIKISGLRVSREVLDITETDLAFTVAEIEKLYCDIFHLSLQSKTFAGIQAKTGGWVAALILFFHSLKGKNQKTVDDDLLKMKGSHTIISSYLEENAYEMLPPETKDFLVKTSLLSKIKVDFCNQLLTIDNSKEIVSDLEKRHLFTFQLDDEADCYIYHHIFQDFLKTKLQTNYSRDEIQLLQIKTAKLLEQDGDEEEALEYYLESEQMIDSFRIIGKIINMLWMKGRHQRLKAYIKRIPPKYLQKEPWIQFLNSQWLDLTGRALESVQCLEQSYDAFLKDKEPYGAALCLTRLGNHYSMDGDSLKAEQNLQAALDIYADNIELTTISTFHNIEPLAQQGKFEQADQCYETVMASLINIKDKGLRTALEASANLQMGHRCLLSGDFFKSLDFLNQAKHLIENTDFYTLQTVCCFQVALAHYLMGNFSKGLESAEKGLKIVRDEGLCDFFPSGWLHHFVSVNCFELDQPIKAMEHIHKSLQIFENIGNSWGRGACYIVFFQIYRHLGDEVEALKYLSLGETALGRKKIPWVEFGLKVAKILLYLKNNESRKAQKLLESTDKAVTPFKSLANWIRFVWARYYWLQDNKEKALEYLLKGVITCRENQYYFFNSDNNAVVIRMLVELYSRGKEQLYIKKVFNRWGFRSKPSLIDLYQSGPTDISQAALELLKHMPVPALKVSCLGEFKLFYGTQEIPAETWNNKKAKLLFKFLLTERSRGFIPKEVLIEMLWPDEDIKKTSNRLWVTLSALRKTLEPDLVKGMSSSYILNDADGYKLDLGENGTIDVDEFREQIRLAQKSDTEPEKSIRHYIAAESLYNGDFLAEDLYVDWVAEKRDHYRDIYLSVLGRLIEYYEVKKEYLKCSDYAKKYLSVDIYAEDMYQKLMTYYAHTGNIAMITLTYENCKHYIEEDLCSPLSEKTESLYDELILTAQ